MNMNSQVIKLFSSNTCFLAVFFPCFTFVVNNVDVCILFTQFSIKKIFKFQLTNLWDVIKELIT